MITYSKNTVSSVQTNDEQRSLKSSRKEVKKLQRSTSRESSRSHSKQHETSSIRQFYVKNLWNKQAENSVNESQHQSNGIKIKKKRQPTPCKSKKQIPSLCDTQSKNKQQQRLIIIEKNIAINQLETSLTEKQSQIEKLYKKVKRLEEQIYNLQKQVQQKEQKNAKLIFFNKQTQCKINQLEQTILRNEQSFNLTNNSLERLKKSIQESRLNDLKTQNDGFKSRVSQLTNQLQKTSKQSKQRAQKIIELEKQNKVLKGKIQLELNYNNQSMKEAYLQGEIKRLKDLLQKSSNSCQRDMFQTLNKNQVQQTRLKNEVKKLMIQLDYIHRKHMQQIRLLNKTKAEQIAKYRKKYKELHIQYLKREKQWQDRLNQKKENNMNNLFTITKKLIIDENQNDKLIAFSGLDKDKSIRTLSMSFQLSSDND